MTRVGLVLGAGGLVLMVIEVATPSGFFVMFFGLGALTVGVLSRLGIGGAPWLEWLLFTATSIVYLLLFRGRLARTTSSGSTRRGPPRDPDDPRSFSTS